EADHQLRVTRRAARGIEQRLAAPHGPARGVYLRAVRVDAARERADVAGRHHGEILGRPERRVRWTIHERVQEGPARPLLALDARDVGVNARQLQLQAQHVLNAAVTRTLIELGQLHDPRGEAGVLEMQAQL